MPPLISFEYTLRSRYGETDKMGYVYHGKYMEYFEVARTEMIRGYGLSYSTMEEEGIMLPVIHAEIDFKSPVYYDEEMVIRVMVFEKPAVKLETWYQVNVPGRDKVCVEGKVVLCFMNDETRRPCRAPGYFLENFE